MKKCAAKLERPPVQRVNNSEYTDMKNREKVKQKLRKRKKLRIRSKISGTSQVPRLVVTRGNRNIAAQLVDDDKSKTLCTVTSISGFYKKLKNTSNGKMEISKQIGLDIAKLAKDKKISSVVFDRNGRKYHGRIKMVAEGAREGGLKF